MVQRHRVVDEEKRTRIQQLRNNGQIIESRKSHDIPFGIRAIQSGIQVDGIWISQTNTPAPSVLKLGHRRGNSQDHLASTVSSKGVECSELRYEDTQPSSKHRGSSFRSIDLGNPSDAGDEKVHGNKASYKPRTCSHLRYGSHGVYDEETLDQLEGRISPKGKVRAHRPRGSRKGKVDVDSSSAADNERSSDNASDSETSLSQKADITDPSRQALLIDKPTSGGRSLSISSVPSGRPVTANEGPESAKAEYFSVPIESPDYDKPDPFETPLMSPLESLLPQQTSTSPNWLDGAEQPGTSTQSSLPFVPGELHINTVARKVNSGFEVLPAGTFGKHKAVAEDANHESGVKRHSAKLQKKHRNSLTGGRPSSTMERP